MKTSRNDRRDHLQSTRGEYFDRVRHECAARHPIQAAILLEKLTIFDDEVKLRQGVADRYSKGLKDLVQTPVVIPGATSVWAQYTISINDRDVVAARRQEQAVPTESIILSRSTDSLHTSPIRRRLTD